MAATKEQREEWKRIGLCSRCGKNRVTDGYLTCQECRDKDKANREYKREHNLCVKCGRNHVSPNRKYCDECLEWRRDRYEKKKQENPEFINVVKEYSKRHREKYISEGKCVICGKPVFENHTFCYECLLTKRNRAKRDRALAKEYKGE